MLVYHVAYVGCMCARYELKLVTSIELLLSQITHPGGDHNWVDPDVLTCTILFLSCTFHRVTLVCTDSFKNSKEISAKIGIMIDTIQETKYFVRVRSVDVVHIQVLELINPVPVHQRILLQRCR